MRFCPMELVPLEAVPSEATPLAPLPKVTVATRGQVNGAVTRPNAGVGSDTV